MNAFFKFNQYQNYTWVYLIGAVLTLVNGIWFQNAYLMYACLFLLYCILFYKSLHILVAYRQAANKGYQKVDAKAFAATYNPFRLRVSLFWLAFILLCFFSKFVLQLDDYYFYSGTFFFLLLDRWFINIKCLLRLFSDPKKKIVQCCCGCPCRGWDLMMIHTPLLFALEYQAVLENAFVAVSSIIAAVSLLCWEKAKYSLVVVKTQCATPCNLTLCRENLHS